MTTKTLITFLLLTATGLASTPDQDAYAFVAISKAIILIGKKQPTLPGNGNPYGNPFGSGFGDPTPIEPATPAPPPERTLNQRDDQGQGRDTGPKDGSGFQLAPLFVVDQLEASVIIRVSENGDLADSNVGSGTVIGSNQHGSDVLTCAHLERDMTSPVYVVEHKGTSYPAKLVRLDRQPDLAMLHIDHRLLPVKLGKNIPSDNAAAFSIGLNAKSEPFRITGYDTHGRPKAITGNWPEKPGRSGGGLYVDECLVGVIHAVEASGGNRRSFYISIEEIHDFLTAPLPPMTLPPQTGIPKLPPDVAQHHEFDDLPPAFNAPQFVPPQTQAPMRLTIEPPMQAAPGAKPAPYHVTVITTTNCPPCSRMKAENGNGNEHVQCTYVDDGDIDVSDMGLMAIKSLDLPHPVTCWPDANGTMRYLIGQQSLDAILSKIKSNNPPSPELRAMTAGGRAGSLQAGQHIKSMFAFWRSRIGDVKANFIWERSGSQKLNLLHLQEWSEFDIFGSAGRMEVSAKGATNLPIDQFGFAYRLRGQDVVFNADDVTVKGLAALLKVNAKPDQGMKAGPMGVIGIDDVLLGSQVFSVIRELCSLLWPTVDLQLPGQVAASAVLGHSESGDMLTVEFNSGPAVALKMLFSFSLKVTKVEISETNVRVHFSGSRWIKFRDFPVK